MDKNTLNLFAAIILSMVIIFGWQTLFAPKHNTIQNVVVTQNTVTSGEKLLDREIALKQGNRIKIESDVYTGSINLKGLRFDDITLLKYHENVENNSPNVSILSPFNSTSSYFVELGWHTQDPSLELPNLQSIWKADKDTLRPGETVNFSWHNEKGITFIVSLAIGPDYMFDIKQTVKNSTKSPLKLQNYGLINRFYETASNSKSLSMVHHGAICVSNDELIETKYDEILNGKAKSLYDATLSWIGVTDKYWLASIVPSSNFKYSVKYAHKVRENKNVYQVDFISTEYIVDSLSEISNTSRLFVGPKKVDLLDKYKDQYKIQLFDRAIDFGWLYILTKPIFQSMNFFYGYTGNFGISIMIVTILIRIFMFSFSSKAYLSMKKMKNIQPQIEKIKEKYKQDAKRVQQEMIALYKKENINPVSGCLPIVLQIPIFFAIYKVLCVTIEMRHAPFFGWIRDLSAEDPTSILTLFGLIPISLPGFLHIGVWSCIMSITMFLQQRLSPAPADPGQALAIKLMPLLFLFLFSSFPAGLLIYWSWNNILSILQQLYVNRSEKNA